MDASDEHWPLQRSWKHIRQPFFCAIFTAYIARTMFVPVMRMTSFHAGSQVRQTDAMAEGHRHSMMLLTRLPCQSMRVMLCCRRAGTYDNGLQRHFGKISIDHTLG